MVLRYDEPVEVRRRDDAPEQFLWRGRLWQVRAVLDVGLVGEREVWRVEAGRGLLGGTVVVELVLDRADGLWAVGRDD